MRVLFITRKWPPAIGGMETYSVELVGQLAKLTHLETRVLPGQQDGTPPGSLALIKFILVNLWFIAFNGKKYDIIHIGDFVLAPLGVFSKWFARPAKVVMMIHGLDILYGNRPGLFPAIFRFYQWLLTVFICADQYIANSENTGLICIEKKLMPVTVIPLGVNTKLPAVDTRQHQHKILFLGRLVVRKGALWFAENILPRLDKKFEFVVVGKTWDQTEEIGLKKCPAVKLVGYASDELLASLKSESCLAVMPNQPSINQTDVEGFGLVAAELSVQGIPLIASNIEGLTSAVIDHETGFLLPHDDIEAWVEKTNEIASWEAITRQQYSENCRQKAMEYYNWERVAKDTLETYQQMRTRDQSIK